MATATASKTWSYTSRDDDGRLVRGRLDAVNEAAAIAKVRGLGLTPLTVEAVQAGTGLNREINISFLQKKVDAPALAVMCRQLATMITAGVALLRALTILSQQTENKKLAGLLDEVVVEIERGSALSDALARHPDDFPPLLTNMVRAGEIGGFLDEALESLAVNYEKESKLRSQIRAALAYPVVVLVICLVAVVLMLVFIVPIFKNLFESVGGQLPLPTQVLVVASENMWWILPLLLVLIIAGNVWWRQNKRNEKIISRVDRIKLRLPVFGPLLTKISVARFCRNLSNMLKSGVPILTALSVVAETSGNWVVSNAAHRTSEAVRAGQSIAGPIADEKVFPPMVAQMIAVGEDSGALDTMLSKVADFYDHEIESTTEALASLIEPLLIVVLGAVVGGMVVALYLPIFNLSSAIQGS